MAKIVALPNGQEAEFPDAMSNDDIASVLRRQFAPTKAGSPSVPTPEDAEKYGPAAGMGPLDKLAVGAGAAVDRAYRGVRGLLPPGLLPKDLSGGTGEEDAVLYQKYHPGGWATTGEVAGDVAMSVLPIGSANKIAQGVKAAAVLPKAVARFVPAAADIAANAAYSAATTPDGERDTAALYGGAGALGGRVLTRTLGGVVRPSAAAQELMDQGVRLTPGQAGEGAMGALASGYERGLATVPIIGSPVTAARREALDDWQKVLAQKVRPQGAEVRSIADVAPAYRQAYKEALPPGEVIKPSPDVLESIRSHTSDMAEGLPPSSRAKFEELTAWIDNRLENGVKSEHWKEEIGNEIAGVRKAAKRDGQNSLVRALNELEQRHIDPLSSANRDVAALDRGYRDFQVLKKAGEKAAALKRGAITPDELLQTASKANNERLIAAAQQAQPILQGAQGPQGIEKAISLAKGAAGAAVGHTVTGGVAIPAAVLSLLGATEIGRKVLLGQYPWQRLVQEYPEFGAKVMRAWVNSSQEQPQPGGR